MRSRSILGKWEPSPYQKLDILETSPSSHGQGKMSYSVPQQRSSCSNHPSKLVQTTSEQQVVDLKEFPFIWDHDNPSLPSRN